MFLSSKNFTELVLSDIMLTVRDILQFVVSISRHAYTLLHRRADTPYAPWFVPLPYAAFNRRFPATR